MLEWWLGVTLDRYDSFFSFVIVGEQGLIGFASANRFLSICSVVGFIGIVYFGASSRMLTFVTLCRLSLMFGKLSRR